MDLRSHRELFSPRLETPHDVFAWLDLEARGTYRNVESNGWSAVVNGLETIL
jgi:hypothetical protein